MKSVNIKINNNENNLLELFNQYSILIKSEVYMHFEDEKCLFCSVDAYFCICDKVDEFFNKNRDLMKDLNEVSTKSVTDEPNSK